MVGGKTLTMGPMMGGGDPEDGAVVGGKTLTMGPMASVYDLAGTEVMHGLE